MHRLVREWSTTFAVALVSAILGVCVGCGRAPQARALTESARASVADLRMRGDYAAAAHCADSLVARIRSDRSAHPGDLADAELLATSVRHFSARDAVTRARLSEADRLDADIDRCDRAGDLPAAKQAALRQLDLRRRLLGPAHAEIAASLDRLGQIATDGGDYADAIDRLSEALAMRRSLLGARHPEVVRSLNHLASARKQWGYANAAKALYEEALTLGRAVLGDDAPEVADALSGLGNYERRLEHFPEARRLMLQALDIRRRALGEHSLAVAGSRGDLGLVMLRLGEWKPAERELERSYAVKREFLGPDHPSLAVVLSLLGHCRQAQGRFREALDAHRESARIWKIRERRIDARAALGALRFTQYDDIAANLLALGKTEAAWPMLENGIGRQTFSQLASCPDSVMADSSRGALAEGRFPCSLERVQAALPAQAALIGWLDVTPGMQEEHSAWGYVVRSGGPVHWVRLRHGTFVLGAHRAGYWDPLFQRLSSAANWPVRVDSIANLTREGADLWNERIAPLLPYLGGIHELVVEDSGGFRCPVDALVDPAGGYLGDRFSVSYANSGSVYALLRERAQHAGAHARRKVLAIGDPPFAASQLDAMRREDRLAARPGPEAIPERVRLPDARVLRDAGSGDPTALDQLPRLPETRWEVERIVAALPGSQGLVGSDASEAELYAFERSGRLKQFDTIHLATHVLRGLPQGECLVLARAGTSEPRTSRGAKGAEDGLLFEGEITSRLPLAADLVTLSGCTSAEAGYVYGEGVLGIGQAFLAAGASSVVASLWRTDDRASALLMARFYEDLAGAYSGDRGYGARAPMRKVDALREARNWLRDYRDARSEQPYRNPAYWAAFILVGDPG